MFSHQRRSTHWQPSLRIAPDPAPQLRAALRRPTDADGGKIAPLGSAIETAGDDSACPDAMVADIRKALDVGQKADAIRDALG